MKSNCYHRTSFAVLVLLLSLSSWFSPGDVQAQVAQIVYSPCAYCPGCYSFCPPVNPDPATLDCPVCEEGASAIALPRTGQTKCYDTAGNVIDCAGTGQDGHIRAGVAWPVPRFTEDTEGTLTDNLTGLVWLKDANCIATHYPAFDNDVGAGDGQVTWQHAFDFVAGINSGAYPECGAGLDGWRVPNINEVGSVFNVGAQVPYNWLMGQGFENVKFGYYWSSTSHPNGTHWAWFLETYQANTMRGLAGKYPDQAYYVWPVRGTTTLPAMVPKTGQVKCYASTAPWGEIPCAGTGQDGEIQAGAPWPLPRFIENSDGTITDNLTGLMWLKDANCFGSPSWQDSLNAVADFNANPANHPCSGYTAHYSDWRMGNLNELESLLNYQAGVMSTWLSGGGLLFSNVVAFYYLSSTSRDAGGYASSAWNVSMQSGAVVPGGKSRTGSSLWPVRSAPPKFILTITKEGTGSGTVTSVNTPGIDCGTDCTEPYENGTSVTLEAEPDTGFVFARWSGSQDCADGIVLMNAHRTCTAVFNVPTSSDMDGDGFPVPEDCNDDDLSVYPGAVEVCDGKDNNCDGRIDEGFDADGDGVGHCMDNCPTVANPDQEDLDQDGIGDLCDNCPGHANPDQADADSDGVGDACTAPAMQIQITTQLIQTPVGEKWWIEVYASDPSGIRVIHIWVDGNLVRTCYNRSSCDSAAPVGAGQPAVGVTAFNGNSQISFHGAIPDSARHVYDWMFKDDDGDGILNISDNCRYVANLDQADRDDDGVGDDCDQCEVWMICRLIPHAVDSPVCRMCTQNVRDCEHNGQYYYEYFYDVIRADGCGCKDDDSGEDAVYKKGTVYLETVTREILPGPPQEPEEEICYATSNCTQDVQDSCLDERTVAEHYCSRDGIITRHLPCALGCFDGACDRDSDGDSVVDRLDNCPGVANRTQGDLDFDGVGDACDNCRRDPNNGQADMDGDGVGDACDNCPRDSNADQRDSDNEGLGDACDNCRQVANADQQDADGDGLGDVCDNCWYSSNNDPNDTDGDCLALMFDPAYWDGFMWLQDPHCGDSCDNCPEHWNEYQEDWNGDGAGNACDCNDNFMGPNETAADCGGICPASCDDKWTVPIGIGIGGQPVRMPSLCLPIIYNGDSDDKIDIVFVADEDYGGNTATFLADVRFLIESGYFGADEINNNKCKFNFYYFVGEGDYEPICREWSIPLEYYLNCAFADSAVIIFTGGGRACSSLVFSAPPGDTGTIVHETGHKIFGMKDEYCCDGGYGQPRGHPNIFHSLADCQASSNNPAGCRNFCEEEKCDWATRQECRNWALNNDLDPDGCYIAADLRVCSPKWCNWRGSVTEVDGDGIGNDDDICDPGESCTGYRECCVDGGDGWWKSDPNTCYMKSGNVFEADCSIRVTDNLDGMPACEIGAMRAMAALSGPSSPQDSKVGILTYHIKENAITRKDAKIAYNRPPNYFRDEGDFTIRAYSDSGQLLREFFIDDPREFNLDHHKDFEPGMMMGDDLDFVVIVPLLQGLRRVRIVDSKTQNIMHEIDLADVIVGFCRSNIYDPLCASSDVDGDGYPVPGDCDDGDASVHPGAVEVCDGKDNNCNGEVDEGIPLDDGDVCTEDICDPVTGVQHIPIEVHFGDVAPGSTFEAYIKALSCSKITTGCNQAGTLYCPTQNVTRQAMAAFIIRARFGETFTYTPTPHFTDVSTTNLFFKYIQKLKDEGITTGYADGTFRPSGLVNRSQMAAFIIRVRFGETFANTPTPHFTDVPTTNLFFKYIQKLKDEGITTGCNTAGTQYCPAGGVTRQAMAAFIARAFLGMP